MVLVDRFLRVGVDLSGEVELLLKIAGHVGSPLCDGDQR